MATLFTRIVRGEIPSYKCAENNEFYAFLDINPIKRGHTLVVPKREVDYFFDLDDDEIGRKVAQAVIGLEVDHAHIHLVPIDREDELRQHTTFTPEEFKATANAINTIFEKNKA